MFNIKEIAAKANVSVATISRVLDPDKKNLVHPRTRARVERVIRKYRYFPNRAARAMITALSRRVISGRCEKTS